MKNNNIYEVYFKRIIIFPDLLCKFLIQKQAVRNSRSILK